jgi:hypothetical protein
MRSLAFALSYLIMIPASAYATPLPKGSVAFSPSEVKALYSGNSAVWSAKNKAYFAEDSTVQGFNGEYKFTGTWRVNKNESCMTVKVVGDKSGKSYTDCWSWFRGPDGQAWTRWSVRYDGSKAPKNDYYKDEKTKLKIGNLVSK